MSGVDSKAFLDDVFRVVEHRSYKPGAPPPPPPNEHVPDPMIGSRKRVRYDDLDMEDHDMSGGNGRVFKQAKRGGRQGQQQNMQLPQGMPPFDPNNPMEAFMRMQAMGMGMPEQFGQKQKRKGRCRDFDTKGFCSRGSTCMYDHGSESAWVPPFGGQGGKFYDRHKRQLLTRLEYDPEDPMKNMPMFNPMMAYNFPADNRGRNRRGRGRKGNNRANLSAEGPNHDRTKTTIVIENIPPENLNEDSVREFFSPFGPITEISIKTNKRLATIKFETWDAANAAYQSPKVIFDNRFVKVFWAKDETRKPEEPEIDHEEFGRRQEEAQKQHVEREAKRLEIEQQRQQLEEKQQELLAKHREEMEKLRLKMNGNGSGEAMPTEEGGTTDMLRKKLADLEDEARLLGISPEDEGPPVRGGYRGRGRGRGRFVTRGRGAFRGTSRHATYAQYSIDNRPKRVAVSGVDFTAADKDEALRHFLLVSLFPSEVHERARNQESTSNEAKTERLQSRNRAKRGPKS